MEGVCEKLNLYLVSCKPQNRKSKQLQTISSNISLLVSLFSLGYLGSIRLLLTEVCERAKAALASGV